MDAEATWMLARGMRAQKRKGVVASGSTKRARAEEMSLAAPVPLQKKKAGWPRIATSVSPVSCSRARPILVWAFPVRCST